MNKSDAIKLLYQYKDLDEYILGKVDDNYKNLKKIALIDCDGIITTGESFYTSEGKLLKSYGCYDKEMMKILGRVGWEFEFVSDDKNGFSITKKRIDDLGYELHKASPEERLKIISDYKRIIKYDVVVFIGDSISDIPSLIKADFSGTCNNAPGYVKPFCDYTSNLNGGAGALADILLHLHRIIKDRS